MVILLPFALFVFFGLVGLFGPFGPSVVPGVAVEEGDGKDHSCPVVERMEWVERMRDNTIENNPLGLI